MDRQVAGMVWYTAGKVWLQQVMATEQLSDNIVIAGLYQLV